MSAPRPIFIAALPREVASLVSRRGWRAHPPHRNIHLFEHEEAIVAYAGMGANRVRLAVESALNLGPDSELISVGFAGSCHPSAGLGDILYPTITVDTKTGERFFSVELERKIARNEQINHEILVTVPAPAGIKEKEYLSVSYYARAVDMEAAAVARIARAHNLPFSAIKAISDAHDFELPDMAKFSSSDGQFREAAFAFHLAWHPSLWKSVATLAKGSKLAAKNLHRAIESKIEASSTSRAI